MADKVVGIRIQVNGTEDIIKRISNLNVELEKAKQESAQLKKAISAAVSANNAEDAKKYGEQLAQATARQGELKRESTELNKELRLQQKAFKAAAGAGEGSYAELDAQLSILRSSFKKLSAAEREGEIGKETTAQIDKLNAKLVEEDAKLGIFTRNVGNYSDSVVKALRRAANEDALLEDIQKLDNETKGLRNRFEDLTAAIARGDKNVDLNNTLKELKGLEKQIKINDKALQELNGELKDTNKLESQGGVSARQIRKAGRLGGKAIGAAAGFAGDVFQGAEAFSSFGVAGAAAFGVFAAGGLAFKAISVLDELSKKFNKLESDAAKFSGASGSTLDGIVVDVEAVANTFGKDAGEILKTTQKLSKSLGVDFATALSKVEQGLLTGAGGADDFLGALEGSADAAALAGLSIDGLIGFSNEATSSGLLSERGIEIVSEFGKNIKTNSADAKAALTDALGEEFTNNLFANVQNGSLSTADALTQVTAKLGEAGVTGDEAGKVLADAFGTATAAENQFVLGLNRTIGAIGGYIDQSSGLTRTQQAQLKANKDLASAQQGLAQAFDGTGISLETFGTKVKTTLANVATKSILTFNRLFGDGLAAGREELRKTTESFNNQKEVIANLETNITPLLNRYDELNALLPTLAADSDEAKRAQEELNGIIEIVGNTIPGTITSFDKYNKALGINADAAREYIKQQQQIGKTIEQAQADEAIKQLQKLQDASKKLTSSFDGAGNSYRAVTTLEALGQGFTDPFGKLETTAKRSSAEILEVNTQLQDYGKQLKEVEGILKQTEAGRRQLANNLASQVANVAQDPAAFFRAERLALEQLNAEAAADANKTETEKADAAKKAADAELGRLKKENDRKTEEAARAAAERAKAEREKLLEGDKNTRQALLDAQKETDAAILDLSLSDIESRAKREEEAVRISFERQIEAETKGLEAAAEARIEFLREAAKSTDPLVRKQIGTPEQIAEQVLAIEAQTTKSISEQTSLIIRERDKQLKELAASREAAVREAIESLDAAVVSGALSELQGRLAQTDNQLAAIDLKFNVEESEIEAAANIAKSQLAGLRSANLISEQLYQQELTNIDQQAQTERLALLGARLQQEGALKTQQAEQQKLIAQGEFFQQQAALEQAQRDQEATLKEQLDNQLITQDQYNEAVLFSRETLAQQTVLLEGTTAQEINSIDETLNAERRGAELEFTQAQADIFADRLAAYAEQQKALLEQFAQGVQSVGNFILEGAKAADDFFTAAENRRKAEIEQRFAAELNGARGNAEATAQIEKRKAAELEKIERAAAARRKAIAIAQAIINGAVAVTNILATTPDPTGIFTVARIVAAGVTTAAQIALISSQPFEEGGTIPSGDGMVTGRSHKQGGVRKVIGGRAVELEGGEYIGSDEYGNRNVINKKNTGLFRNVLMKMSGKTFIGKRKMMSAINAYGGNGIAFAQGGTMPAPIMVNTAASANSELVGIFSAYVARTEQIIAALSNQINTIKVIVSASEVLEEGAKQQQIKNAQIV
jgi:hypothetical protein